MKKSTLFAKLPEYVATPDGMAIDKEGNLVLACPNYAIPDMPGCILKIDKYKNIKKWFDVPVCEETGVARPMGLLSVLTGTYTYVIIKAGAVKRSLSERAEFCVSDLTEIK